MEIKLTLPELQRINNLLFEIGNLENLPDKIAEEAQELEHYLRKLKKDQTAKEKSDFLKDDSLEFEQFMSSMEPYHDASDFDQSENGG